MKYTEYTITGMTCGSCVANVKKRLEGVAAVASAEVQLAHPQARVQLNTPLELAQLKQAVEAGGKYQLLPATANAEATLAPLPTIGKAKTVATPENKVMLLAHAAPAHAASAHASTATEPALPEVKLTTYKPLLLIIGFIAGMTLLVQYPFEDVSALCSGCGISWPASLSCLLFLSCSTYRALLPATVCTILLLQSGKAGAISIRLLSLP